MSFPNKISKIINLLSGNAKQREYLKWRMRRGDYTLRLQYPLNKSSVVFDLGGYEGDFAFDMISRYSCQVHLFEPMPKFVEQCRRRFSADTRVNCHDFALGSKDCTFELTDDANGSSMFNPNHEAPTTKVQCRNFNQFVSEHNIETIDLLKINIEGGEYDVIPHLIDTGLIQRINHIQIQFHDFVPNHQTMRPAIRNSLAKTHQEDWNYSYIWESWSRK